MLKTWMCFSVKKHHVPEEDWLYAVPFARMGFVKGDQGSDFTLLDGVDWLMFSMDHPIHRDEVAQIEREKNKTNS